ncbi:sphingomyelin phosphodiesterase-like [Oppia nitens]|uniref:sphingomyelin phosphodiesterase-like n=1 Tax=Oppia nitens TaxID=1686743 RepID=UPI0023DBE7A4|nr:sphingomyelin phosphodiesterase-like [Oppia nitens]
MINDRTAPVVVTSNANGGGAKNGGDIHTSDSLKSRSETKGNTNENLQSMVNIMNDINTKNAASLSTKTRGFFLINILSRMLKSVNFTELSVQMRDGISSRASCLACNAVAGLLLSSIYSKEMMTVAVNTVCTSFRLQSPRVCSGIVESFKDDLDYIRTHTTLKRGEMCGVIFGMDCARKTTKNLNWTIALPDRQNMAERREDGSGDEEFIENAKLKSHTKVVQVTDLHIDPYYTPGSNADCGEPLCCRSSNGVAINADKAAGVWGDYRNCDLPISTLRHALKHISEVHSNALYWMWTGDIAPHDIWNVTRHEVLSQIKLVTNLMKQYIRVPVYPVIGNHEGVPVNSFPPPEVKGDNSISWLYNAVADEWDYWLPKDAIKTLRYGGYYTVKPRSGFRIVCINTNYCARLNPWSLFNPVDPANQLKWLSSELFKAETDGDKVHIIGHIPPDNRECTQAWLYNFLRIIDRYQDTVLAQYYGHTHRDEFRLLYSPYYPEMPINLAYIGPSITPFTENNPSYRLYYMDSDSYLVDHETYYFNLTDANRGKKGPKWVSEYKAMKTFNLTSMSPHSWHELVHKFETNDNFFQNYYKLYYRKSDVKNTEYCDQKCKKFILSDLTVLHPLKHKPKGFFGRRKLRERERGS